MTAKWIGGIDVPLRFFRKKRGRSNRIIHSIAGHPFKHRHSLKYRKKAIAIFS